jgi:hypothetical protein
MEGNDGLTVRRQQELGGAGKCLVSEPEGCRSAMRRHTGERAIRRQEIEGRGIGGHDCDFHRLTGTRSVGVEIIVRRRKDDGGVDLQQGLAQRVSLLLVPNLHGAARASSRCRRRRRRSGRLLRARRGGPGLGLNDYGRCYFLGVRPRGRFAREPCSRRGRFDSPASWAARVRPSSEASMREKVMGAEPRVSDNLSPFLTLTCSFRVPRQGATLNAKNRVPRGMPRSI